MPILANSQIDDLVTYLDNNNYSTLHTADRRYRTVKGVKTLRLIHLHAMWLKPRSIEGYVRGPNIEFQYKLDLSANSRIVYHPNIDIAGADTYLRRMGREIMKAVNASPPKRGKWPKRTKGMFYLQRQNNPTFTPAAHRAIRQNILSERFVTTLMQWNFRVIQGR